MDLENIKKELEAREPIFHRLELGTTREALEEMTTEDFFEVGASGKVYSREYVINTLLERYSKGDEDIWETENFAIKKLGGTHYLLTYTLTQNNSRVSLRATIWEKSPNGWKICYHQGTIASMP